MSEKPLTYYELRKVVIEPPKPGEFRLSTAATIQCGLCGTMIDGMGGSGDGPVCVACARELRRGQLRGCVKWPAGHDHHKEEDSDDD